MRKTRDEEEAGCYKCLEEAHELSKKSVVELRVSLRRTRDEDDGGYQIAVS